MKYLIATAIALASCSNEMPTPEADIWYPTEPADTAEPCTEPILSGLYEISHVVIDYGNGTELMFTYEDSPYWDERDGQMSYTTYEFVDDEILTSVLVEQGWQYGDLDVIWKDCMPVKVGCRQVVHATDTVLAWKQNDWTITNYFVKL